ncbi:MAG: primosomal replication protein N [Burkholderiaceae bacterium]|nr:primosomal replication protein N [Burkholderiaceae bacterium]
MSLPPQPCNFVQLRATLAERGSLRFSPGGVALLSATLRHTSQQMQAGAQRTIELEVAAVFAGRLAERAERVSLGASIFASGFLAPRRKASRLMLLNVTEFELIEV